MAAGDAELAVALSAMRERRKKIHFSSVGPACQGDTETVC
jgi:hypothetical protein